MFHQNDHLHRVPSSHKTMSQKTILNPTIEEMRANYEPTLEMKKSAFYYEESEMTQSLIVFIDNMNASRYVVQNFVLWFQALLSLLPVKLTLFNVGLTTVVLVVIMPQTITYILIYPFFRLIFGTLYPAYCSYKAVRSRDVKQYVKWMMYWIVFALFRAVEMFTDIFFSFWFPFYYEIKILMIIWMLSPATKGSSILYRRFVHPVLRGREDEIDEFIAKTSDQGYTTFLTLGTKGLNYATTVLVQTATKTLPSVLPHLRSIDQADSTLNSSTLELNVSNIKREMSSDSMEEEFYPEVPVRTVESCEEEMVSAVTRRKKRAAGIEPRQIKTRSQCLKCNDSDVIDCSD